MAGHQKIQETALKYEVRRSPIHGRGLFAVAPIRKGEIIGHYDGPETRHIGAYTLWIEDDDRTYGISGRNAMRFVNHSCKPNAAFYGRALEALRTIKPGEEITHHYGDDWAHLTGQPEPKTNGHASGNGKASRNGKAGRNGRS